ncbi:NAD(P)H-binding protein [Mucilaginibacter sp. RS28]|uniref:NAD(P)H-binding protein n=1 Tax=Mucilaginibacter straminoryzae TaxID=2932774 RepID=A0A9X1X4G1_9SPHI|nr:NAD(P)H-binding protein [Mucilaginibacter straminoryzae]MCJ8210366.1 NAD(P)H-binding protein [Mucilaginibacter straminoryzae]
MKVLLTGANGYVGTRLIPVLLAKGHEVICLVRDKNLFRKQSVYADQVTVVNGDLLRTRSMEPLPADIDAAYYLVNAMVQTSGFAGLEALAAQNFVDAIDQTNCRQIISLSEIDDHLENSRSRQHVEEILSKADAAITILKTTMMIGPGSVANELMDGLTRKMPVIIASMWAKAQEQPIAVCDVVNYLEGCLLNAAAYNSEFHISGPEILTFRQMLTIYGAECKGAKVKIMTVPQVSSALSSYWLNFLTPISYSHAKTLVENLKYDLISRDDAIVDIVPFKRLTFKEALHQAN